MPIAETTPPTSRKPLRLWPGVVAVTALWLARFGLKAIVPGFAGFQRGVMWGLGGVLAVLLWWVFFSRASRWERWGGIALMIGALVGAWLLRHESMGPLWLIAYALPVSCLALVAGAAAGRRLANGPRRATVFAAILLACGGWTLVRMEGISGDHVVQFRWRWAKSAEERLQDQAGAEAGGALRGSGGSAAGGRLARLSRSRARRHPARGADRDQLVGDAARRAVAPADRTRLVVLRGPRRPPLHPGAAR